MEEICRKIVEKLTKKNQTISFMESCTGGFLANEITNISGASKVLKVSIVTYSTEYKEKFGVDKNVINTYTVYSTYTAKEMANQVCDFAKSDIGIGVTGELGNTDNPVNKVYYAIYIRCMNCYITKELVIEKNERSKMKKDVATEVLANLLEGINEFCK